MVDKIRVADSDYEAILKGRTVHLLPSNVCNKFYHPSDKIIISSTDTNKHRIAIEIVNVCRVRNTLEDVKKKYVSMKCKTSEEEAWLSARFAEIEDKCQFGVLLIIFKLADIQSALIEHKQDIRKMLEYCSQNSD